MFDRLRPNVVWIKSFDLCLFVTVAKHLTSVIRVKMDFICKVIKGLLFMVRMWII